jgi:hypothetical protein
MATVDPQDQVKINKLYQEYIDLLQKVDELSLADAKSKADAARSTGTLTKETERLNRQLQDTVFYTDSIAQGFKETLAELKGQNVQLNIGKSAFKALSNIASDLNYFQKGISDQTEKQFKIQQEKVLKGKEELIDVRNRLGAIGNENKYRNQSVINSLKGQDRLTQSQKNLLKELEKEKALLEAANDAIKEGIPTLQRELDISKQIYDVREKLGGLASAAAGVVSKYGGDLSKFLKVDDAIDSVKKYNQNLIDGALKSKATIAEIQKIEKDRINTIQNSASVQRSIGNEILNIEKQINEIRKESAKEMARRAELIRVEAKLASGQITNQEEINSLLARQVKLKEEIKEIDDERANKINPLENDRLKQQNKLTQAQVKEKQNLAALDEKEANIKLAAIKSVDTLTNKFKSLGVLFKSLGAGFIKGLTDPLTILTFIIDKALEANRQVVELGKSLGVSADVAENLRQEYASFARSTGDTFVNTNRLLKAQSELSKELGIAVRFSNEELATFAKLTELTGLSAQEAGNLAKASAAAGMPTEKYTDSLREAAFFAQQATGTHFSSKEVLQDISKLSAGILVKFQGNPKALGQTVIEAKKLGLTLDQIDKVGESLLNFEQSIENELKAELITGKQLNLERARAAALSGDQLALTREISSQVGTLNDFQNMNVIAQKSLADAFGLSREEMAEMLIKQEAINKYGDEAAKLNKEQLEDMKRQGLSASEYLKKQEQQRTAQDKFQDAMIKLQDIIGNLVAGPVGQLLDALADIVTVAVNILSIFSPIFSLISGIAELISDIASSLTGKFIIGLAAVAILLPRIASGFGGIFTGLTSVVKSIPSLGKSLGSAFSVDGVKKYFSSIKEGFIGSKALAAAQSKGLSEKQILAGFGGKEAKDALNKKLGSTTADKTKKLAEKTAGAGEKAGASGPKAGDGIKNTLKGISAGIQSFSKVSPADIAKLAFSALALIALTPAIPALLALQFVNGKLIQSALTGLGKGLSALGNALSKPQVILGVGVFTLAMMGLGKALGYVAPAIEAFGKAIKLTFEGIGAIITSAANGIATIFGSLQNVDVMKLLAIGPALIGIGVGLASLGAGGVIGAVGAFLGGNPIEKLQDLAASGDGLAKTATALQSIAGALIGVSVALASIDISKLEALNEFSSTQATNSAVKGITDFITAPIKTIGGGKEEINNGVDLTPMIVAINEVKVAIDRLYNKDTSINMDGKKVGTTLVQGSYRVA